MAVEYVPYSGPVVTRAQAKAQALPHFFDGIPCMRQHLAQRYVSTGACLACQALYLAKARERERARKQTDPDYREKRLAAQRIRQRRWDDVHEEAERERKRLSNATPEAKAKRKAWADTHRPQINAKTAERYRLLKETDPERLKETWRRNYWKNPQRALAYTKRWQAENAERLKAYQEATKEQRAETSRRWAKVNPERAAAKTRRWQAKNPNAWREYRKNNPEAYRAIKLRYRAALASAEGSHTAAELKALFEKQDGRCAYCGRSIRNGYDADHIVPLSRGGSNWITNIQLCCASCNRRKWAHDHAEFARRRLTSKE